MIHKTYSGMHFIHKLGLFCCIFKKPKKFMINVLTNFEMNTVPYVLIPFLTLSDFFLFKLGSYSNSWWYLEQGGRLTSSMQLVAEVWAQHFICGRAPQLSLVQQNISVVLVKVWRYVIWKCWCFLDNEYRCYSLYMKSVLIYRECHNFSPYIYII